MRIIDRYVVRQILAPFGLGVLVFTFLFIIDPLRDHAQPLLARGISPLVVLKLIGLLLPQALALTIPMSLLLALLIAFGRLSADREFVAMQACGISLVRLLRPVGVAALLGWAATSYMFFTGMPKGNQAFREIVFDITADRAEGEVKPRVFFTDFPGLVLYVREIPSSGEGWQGVLLYDMRQDSQRAMYLARRGRVVVDRPQQKVELVLEDGSRHSEDLAGKYEVFRFPDRLVLSLNPSTLFGDEGAGPGKGPNEMTLTELFETIEEHETADPPISTHNQWIAVHHKFAIPLACLIFGVIGVALGATNSRGGALGSFVLGVIVVFVYYMPLVFGVSIAKGGVIPPWLAAWLPDMILGALAVGLFVWRDRVADQPIHLPLPKFLRRSSTQGSAAPRQSRWRVPGLGIIDRYVSTMYVRVFLLTLAALLTVSYIASFIDLSDKLFKGTATVGMMAEFLWRSTPQFVYYILPLAVLLAALVTVALLTKNSELVVMKACGISLYRIALPMLAASALIAMALFGIEETLLGPANRRAQEIRHVMNGGSAQAFGMLHRQWVAATNGDIYHFTYFDPARQELAGVTVYEFTEDMGGLAKRTFAHSARYISEGPDAGVWQVDNGWVREFDAAGEPVDFTAFERMPAQLESPSYFATEPPDPRFMGYTQLRGYTERLEAGGVDVVEQRVWLARKLSFPFVTLVMTLLAVPFAVTIGRSGAMAGIGVGIALALTYWTAETVFAAFGMGGLLPPALAAWAPNLLFGAGAAYLVLTVRT